MAKEYHETELQYQNDELDDARKAMNEFGKHHEDTLSNEVKVGVMTDMEWLNSEPRLAFMLDKVSYALAVIALDPTQIDTMLVNFTVLGMMLERQRKS